MILIFKMFKVAEIQFWREPATASFLFVVKIADDRSWIWHRVARERDEENQSWFRSKSRRKNVWAVKIAAMALLYGHWWICVVFWRHSLLGYRLPIFIIKRYLSRYRATRGPGPHPIMWPCGCGEGLFWDFNWIRSFSDLSLLRSLYELEIR